MKVKCRICKKMKLKKECNKDVRTYNVYYVCKECTKLLYKNKYKKKPTKTKIKELIRRKGESLDDFAKRYNKEKPIVRSNIIDCIKNESILTFGN